jgi:hypothetical protein
MQELLQYGGDGVEQKKKEVETWQLNWECHINIHGPRDMVTLRNTVLGFN